MGLGPDSLEHLEGDDGGQGADCDDPKVHEVMSPNASGATPKKKIEKLK